MLIKSTAGKSGHLGSIKKANVEMTLNRDYLI